MNAVFLRPTVLTICTGIRTEVGNDEQFRRIFECHVDAALRVAVGIVGDPAEAEDVVQEMFVRLYRALPRLDATTSLRSYIYRATVRTALNALRRRSGTQTQFGAQREPLAPNPEELVERREQQEIVFRLMRRIPEQQRAAFVLREIEGLEMDEVAEALGCSRTTARVHLHLARKALRQMIEREYPELLEGRADGMQRG